MESSLSVEMKHALFSRIGCYTKEVTTFGKVILDRAQIDGVKHGHAEVIKSFLKGADQRKNKEEEKIISNYNG